ncbi:MAG: family 20 glycosylhydrolase [Bacteroidales bacterium]|nr:family 20 glycosylhydrolase [Bacteroidales bacterium]
MKKILAFIAALTVALAYLNCTEKVPDFQSYLIPKPDSIEIKRGYSSIKPPFEVVSESNITENLSNYILNNNIFLSYISLNKKSNMVDKQSDKKNTSNNSSKITLQLSKSVDESDESYQLEIGKNSVTIKANSDAGLFYGLQTLIQLTETENKLPQMVISDSPRFEYRGMHLDVSRHFYSVDFIKKQLDMMAYYKLNRFHWHLTDGAGWRMEVKKYPLLTDIAAWRPYKNWKEWYKGDKLYCSKDDENANGGYYTVEQMKDVVEYAAQRNITVIPEIELPSHSEEVLAVYPKFSCTGIPYKSSDFCPGNEKTFEFLQDIFDEVLEIFPSKMIHLGGDEAGKADWKKCPKCLKRMRENNLKDVDELQSYFVSRMGAYLNSKGRTFIGWDEILEGGLAENAVVMSWRGEEGGIKAVKSGHNAIMTPGGYCYFDAYQLEPSTQPEAIGGYLTVEKVYSYNPVPDSLNNEEAKFIMGVQGNVWTEYMPTPKHTEYMIYPRIAALAEVAWSNSENRSWNEFKPRINRHVSLLKEKGVNSCNLNADVLLTQNPDTINNYMVVEMNTDLYPASIYYTIDGSEPTVNSNVYKKPLNITDPTDIKAAVFVNNVIAGNILKKNVSYHKAINKKLTYNCIYSWQYPAGGDKALIDGYFGGFGYGDGRWQGFLKDMDVVIDLGQKTKINRIEGKFMQIIGPWVWMPQEVEVLVSDDGVNYESVAIDKNDIPVEQDGVLFRYFGFKGDAEARFINYKAKHYKGFMFIDEIVVE